MSTNANKGMGQHHLTNLQPRIYSQFQSPAFQFGSPPHESENNYHVTANPRGFVTQTRPHGPHTATIQGTPPQMQHFQQIPTFVHSRQAHTQSVGGGGGAGGANGGSYTRSNTYNQTTMRHQEQHQPQPPPPRGQLQYVMQQQQQHHHQAPQFMMNAQYQQNQRGAVAYPQYSPSYYVFPMTQSMLHAPPPRSNQALNQQQQNVATSAALHNIPIVAQQPPPHIPSMPKTVTTGKSRPNAIPIINPNTGTQVDLNNVDSTNINNTKANDPSVDNLNQLPPPLTYIEPIPDMVSTLATPVVSAMLDGPHVNIIPKQTKSKALPIEKPSDKSINQPPIETNTFAGSVEEPITKEWYPSKHMYDNNSESNREENIPTDLNRTNVQTSVLKTSAPEFQPSSHNNSTLASFPPAVDTVSATTIPQTESPAMRIVAPAVDIPEVRNLMPQSFNSLHYQKGPPQYKRNIHQGGRIYQHQTDRRAACCLVPPRGRFQAPFGNNEMIHGDLTKKKYNNEEAASPPPPFTDSNTISDEIEANTSNDTLSLDSIIGASLEKLDLQDIDNSNGDQIMDTTESVTDIIHPTDDSDVTNCDNNENVTCDNETDMKEVLMPPLSLPPTPSSSPPPPPVQTEPKHSELTQSSSDEIDQKEINTENVIPENSYAIDLSPATTLEKDSKIEVDVEATTEVIAKNQDTNNFDALKRIPVSKTVPIAKSTNQSEPKRVISKTQNVLQYEAGQWSPTNASGRKFYNRDQLMQLRSLPASLTPPDCNSTCFNSIAKANNLLPKFMDLANNYTKPSQQQRNNTHNDRPLHGSQHFGGSGGGKSSKSGMIHVSLSLRQEVKLSKTENAWKPSFFPKEVRDENAEDLLYRQVRGVLNKLTPEKFTTLLEQMIKLEIDTEDKLNGVINLVFEKAIDEPNFSNAYAHLCFRLSAKWLGERGKSSSNNPNDRTNEDASKEQFKKTLINKCQTEFYNHVDSTIESKLQPFEQKVNECTDLDQKAEFTAILEDEERKLRRRSVGTVRFIGELYKIDMLTPRIMIWCVTTLLSKNCEDKLECLCKLLTTVGAKLEAHGDCYYADLEKCFKDMLMIVYKKPQSLKLSSRVRFMLQDVIDLRSNKWVPRRTDVKPKMMSQIQKEAELEQNTIQLLNYNLETDRKDDSRGGGASGGGGYNQNKSSRANHSEDGWSSVASKNRSTFTVDPSKFRAKTNIEDNTLGYANQFKWNQMPAANHNTAAPAQRSTMTSNSYSALASSRGGSTGGRKDQFHSKSSMERDRYDGRRSQNNSRENSVGRNYSSSTGGRVMQAQRPGVSQSMHAMISQQPVRIEKPTQSVQSLNNVPDQTVPTESIIRLVKELLDGHSIGEVQVANSHVDLQCIHESRRWEAVQEMCNIALELKSASRVFAGEVSAHWIATKTITVDGFLYALAQFLETVADLIIDIPKIWSYIAEIITPVVKQQYISVHQLKLASKVLIDQRLGGELLRGLIAYWFANYGSQFVRDIFVGTDFSDFMHRNEIATFVASNKFEFIFDSTAVTYQQSSGTDIDKVLHRIKELLMNNSPPKEIFQYIKENMSTIDKQFIRALTTIILNRSMKHTQTTYTLNEATFRKDADLLELCIDKDELNEVQCLFAIQILVTECEHPSGVLWTILNILYEHETISLNALKTWRNSTDEPQGKGVCVTSLSSFFTMLEESQEDSESDGDN